MIGKNAYWLGRLNLDKYTGILLCAFSILGFISTAIGNIFIGLSTVLLFFNFYQKKKFFKNNCMGYHKVIIFSWCMIFISSLFSSNILNSTTLFAKYWIWHFISFFIITFNIDNYNTSKKIFFCSCVGIFLEILLVIYQGLQGIPRAPGFHENAMFVAGLLGIYIPIFFILLVDGHFSKKIRLISGCMFILSSIALLYNGTRGVWLAVLFTCLSITTYYLFKNKKNFCFAGVVLLIFCGFALSNNKYIERFQSISDTKAYSASARLYVWKSSINIFRENPITGVGVGNFKSKYNKIADNKYKILNHAHSNIFHLLAETGIIGIIGYFSLFMYIIFKSIIEIYNKKNIYYLMILAVTSAFLIQGMTEYNLIIGVIVKYYWLLLGCFVVMGTGKDKIAN